MYVQNHIPVLTLIVEPIVATSLLIIAILSFKKHRQRKRQSTLMISLSFLSFFLAVFTGFVGKLWQFFSSIDADVQSPGAAAVVLTFLFCALGAFCIFSFVNEIFMGSNDIYNIIAALVMGIIAGWSISQITLDPSVEEKLANITIVVFLYITTICVTKISLCIREMKLTEDKLSKIGYTFIMFYGILLMVTFLLFVTDVIYGSIINTTFTVFYYIGWSFTFFAVSSGYIGYNLPKFVRNLFKI